MSLVRGTEGDDKLDGKGGFDECNGGGGNNTAVNCEQEAQVP